MALRLKTSGGEERTLVAKPGETKSERFSATVGFTVDVTSDSGPQPPGVPSRIRSPTSSRELLYRRRRWAAGDGSAAGGAAAGSGDGGGLPVTGAAAGAVAGVAGALLTIGVVLFSVARRRRVKFSA